MVEISSLFSNGYMVITYKSSADTRRSIDKLLATHVPEKLSLKETLARHQQNIQQFLADFPTESYVELKTLADMKQATRHSIVLNEEYQQSIGYVTDQQLKSILGNQYDRLADKVRGWLNQLKILASVSNQ